MSKKRKYACWKCGKAMGRKATFCKRCRRTQPAAVKAQRAALSKALGGKVRPVPVPVPSARAALPRCANPACGKRAASAAANCCGGCGRPYSAGHMDRADKAARAMQAGLAHTPEHWEAKGAGNPDPEVREKCRAEAAALRKAAGTEAAHAAAVLMKASGSLSLEEAYRRQTDPHAKQILLDVLNGR